MRMKRNGFTLIELLAVIVILAVIALIATPIIMNVINDSKKGAAKDSMYSYVKAVELAATQQLKPDTDLMNGTYTVKDGNLYTGSTKILDIELKGTKPENDGTITLIKGRVTSSDLKFDGYCVGYNGTEAVNKDNCSSSSTPTPSPTSAPIVTFTAGDVVYYNPETNKKCTVGEVNTTANAKTGCLKWNVITTGDTTSKTTIDIILDHNTTATVAWNSSGNNADGMKEVDTALKADVATWSSSIKSSARLIRGQEVANIGNDSKWNYFTGTMTYYPSWLTQNLSSSNTTEKSSGYWTSTANNYSYKAWLVMWDGRMYTDDINKNDVYGVRPVITVSKTVIS